MDDLAPAPTQRTFDAVGRVRDENLRARKKAAKKAPLATSSKQEVESETVPIPEPEPGSDHQLDLLA
jgi:hypothetical protein